MEQQTGSKLGKEYIKAVYCHLAYLTSMQSMRNVRLNESQSGLKIAWRNINNLKYAADTSLMAESKEELKSLLINRKKETEKVCLKLNIQKKLRSWLPVPSLHGKYMRKQWKQWQTSFSWAPKSLQAMTAAIKLKAASSLEEKL